MHSVIAVTRHHRVLINSLQDAVAEFATVDFCSLEEPTTPLEEFPEIHPSAEHHHPDADTITELAWH
jgi:hypothetical protein